MVFTKYPKQGIVLLVGFGRAMKYPSIQMWCLIIKYHNESINFLVGFDMVMQYPSKCQKICYRV